MAAHAQIGIVVAAINGETARKIDLRHLVPLVGEPVGVAVRTGEAVLGVRRWPGFAGGEILRQALRAVTARAHRRDLLLLVQFPVFCACGIVSCSHGVYD